MTLALYKGYLTINMKKCRLILFFLCSTLLLMAAPKQTVAVYTIDESDLNVASYVGDFIVNSIVKQSKYSAVERSSAFRSQLNSEHDFERSGEVDDKQIAELGKNFGAIYVCVVKVGFAMNQYFVSSRMINTETSIVDRSSRPVFFDHEDITYLEDACLDIIQSMFDNKDELSKRKRRPIRNTVSTKKQATAKPSFTPTTPAKVAEAPKREVAPQPVVVPQQPVAPKKPSYSVQSCDHRISVKFVSCKRYGSSVTIDYLITNNSFGDIGTFIVYTPACDNHSTFYDNEGNHYNKAKLTLGTQQGSCNVTPPLIEGAPYKASITIENVSETATQISCILYVIGHSRTNNQLNTNYIKFRNIPLP